MSATTAAHRPSCDPVTTFLVIAFIALILALAKLIFGLIRLQSQSSNLTTSSLPTMLQSLLEVDQAFKNLEGKKFKKILIPKKYFPNIPPLQQKKHGTSLGKMKFVSMKVFLQNISTTPHPKAEGKAQPKSNTEDGKIIYYYEKGDIFHKIMTHFKSKSDNPIIKKTFTLLDAKQKIAKHKNTKIPKQKKKGNLKIATKIPKHGKMYGIFRTEKIPKLSLKTWPPTHLSPPKDKKIYAYNRSYVTKAPSIHKPIAPTKKFQKIHFDLKPLPKPTFKKITSKNNLKYVESLIYYFKNELPLLLKTNTKLTAYLTSKPRWLSFISLALKEWINICLEVHKTRFHSLEEEEEAVEPEAYIPYNARLFSKVFFSHPRLFPFAAAARVIKIILHATLVVGVVILALIVIAFAKVKETHSYFYIKDQIAKAGPFRSLINTFYLKSHYDSRNTLYLQSPTSSCSSLISLSSIVEDTSWKYPEQALYDWEKIEKEFFNE
ncbi:uncharacterized protein TNCT_187881 [Trichonephila clavata]|uniref:Uncharacterized protein n=1 Tax=Trichonephila clavata TaxID=2740835 RepID=A0A8X6IMN6_TRICU|nr:uncharacterized protein TNCT_187881 [Trichonephila clavata]